MRFSRSVVQSIRDCPWGGLKAACPQCISLAVTEATTRAHSRTGEEPIIRLAWLIGVIDHSPGLEHAARRVVHRRRKAPARN